MSDAPSRRLLLLTGLLGASFVALLTTTVGVVLERDVRRTVEEARLQALQAFDPEAAHWLQRSGPATLVVRAWHQGEQVAGVPVLVHDAGEEPVASGTTGADGVALALARGGLVRVTALAPWAGQLEASVDGDGRLDLAVRRACPGEVVVTLLGEPFGGRVRLGTSWRDLPADGRITWGQRPCGDVEVAVAEPHSTRGRRVVTLAGLAEPGRPTLLEVPPAGEAVLQVVDQGGRPLEVDTSTGSREGVGRYRLRGEVVQEVELRPLGAPFTERVRVPMDGAEHTVTVDHQGRRVDVRCTGPGCAERLVCTEPWVERYQPVCRETGPGRWGCACPVGDAVLTATWLAEGGEGFEHTPLALVPGGDHEVQVAGLGWGVLAGAWGGRRPCAFRVLGAGDLVLDEGACDPKGTWRSGRLPAGPVRLEVGWVGDAQGWEVRSLSAVADALVRVDLGLETTEP